MYAVLLYCTLGLDDSNPNSILVEEVLDTWNPMQTDFLSERNVYNIDEEDVGSALLGYS